jgi:hypothetical protein
MIAHSSRRLPERCSALFFALILLFGSLHSAVHARQVRHVVCPDHGELLHVRTPAHVHSEESCASQTIVVQSPADDADHHDVCSVPNALRDGGQAWVASGAFPDAQSFEWLAHALQPEFEPRAETLARYLLAPKQSPPLG